MIVPLMATSLIATAASRMICREGVYHTLSRNYLPREAAAQRAPDNPDGA